MRKPTLYFLLFSLFSSTLYAQKVSGKLHFEPGKTIRVSMEVKNSITQQAGAQAIPFLVEGRVTHSYTITTATTGSATLHHELQGLDYHFDGMGQKISFDSENKADRQSASNKSFDEILSKKYDLVVDSSGTTLMTTPEKIEAVKPGDKMVILDDMLRDLTAVAYPPKKGSSCFFHVFPGYEVGAGDSWTDSSENDEKKSVTVSTLSAITDSTLIVDFKTTAVTHTKSEMMGMEASTVMNYTSSGKIVVDKLTGLVREKTIATDSNGNTSAMNTSLPITGKTTVTIHVLQK